METVTAGRSAWRELLWDSWNRRHHTFQCRGGLPFHRLATTLQVGRRHPKGSKGCQLPATIQGHTQKCTILSTRILPVSGCTIQTLATLPFLCRRENSLILELWRIHLLQLCFGQVHHVDVLCAIPFGTDQLSLVSISDDCAAPSLSDPQRCVQCAARQHRNTGVNSKTLPSQSHNPTDACVPADL